MVYVEKGGEIIPKIVGIEFSERHDQSIKLEYITHCPECETKLERKEGEASHYCPNEETCPPQIKGRILHFISRNAMDIDSLGEGKLEMLIDNGLVKDMADLYYLQYDQLIGLEKIIDATDDKKEKKLSFREKTVENILNGIEASKKITFDKVLFALGIRFVGRTVAKKLAYHYKNIDDLKTVGFEELILVDEIGEKIAESVVRYFEDPKNLEIINRLKEKGVRFELTDLPEKKSNKLEGRIIVASGKLQNFSRDEIKSAIEAHGGKPASSVSKKTDFLLAGENIGPNKLAKANELGIQIIDEDSFLEMIK